MRRTPKHKFRADPRKCVVFTRAMNSSFTLPDIHRYKYQIVITFDAEHKEKRIYSHSMLLLEKVISLCSQHRLPCEWALSAGGEYVYLFVEEELVAAIIVSELGTLGYKISSEQEYNDDHKLCRD